MSLRYAMRTRCTMLQRNAGSSTLVEQLVGQREGRVATSYKVRLRKGFKAALNQSAFGTAHLHTKIMVS